MAQRRAGLSVQAASALLVVSAMLLLAAAGCDNKDDDSDGSAAGGSSEPASTETAWKFTSRPDLTPPRIDVTTTAAGDEAGVDTEDDLVLLAPKDKKDEGSPMNGPLIVDGDGDPVWIHPLGDTRWSYDLRVQRYQGKPVLTWWQGDTQPFGYGQGEFVLMDQSYREIATVTTPRTPADFHEGRLTAAGTALLISFPEVKHDLSEVGGDEDGYLRDSVVYEIDVDTGKVLFRWSALDHIALTDTQQVIDDDADEAGTKDAPFDPYHVNSVSVDGRHALLVSARNTHAVYRVDRRSGKLLWTLGGKSSDFEMTGDSTFAWQHDAERQRDGTITLYDNEATPAVGEQSRGLRLDVDTVQHTARVVTEYEPPSKRLSDSQGSVEVRDDGSVFVGWGSQPYYSLFSADGTLLQDAELAGGISYRAYRQPWVGRPVEPPKLVVKHGHGYVSWNGATEVDRWQFVVGNDEQSAKVVETVDDDGYETSAKLPDGAYIAARGLDASGKVLATAEPGAWPVR